LVSQTRNPPPEEGRDETDGAGVSSNGAGLGGAARRALAEADERRRATRSPPPVEINGREGPDPVRYGDWEVKGLASDF
jgi:hypothetical protein